MNRPLVTPVEGTDDPQIEPVLILFNDRSGPAQVVEIVRAKHSFVDGQVWQTVDEDDRPAWLLSMVCETATANELLELVGNRLPDYVQARRFPPSRMAQVRASGEQLS